MMSDQAEQDGLPVAVRLLLAGLGVAAAGGLIWLGVSTHMQRACTVMDTPYLPLCTAVAAASHAERQARLRAYLADNPGDSGAWIQLTNLQTGPQTGPIEQALFRAASTLAPTEPNVLMWRAGQALADDELPKATELLVQLVEHRRKREAIEQLARIVASAEDAAALLRPHLPTASRWLPPVLASLVALKLPLASALPLLAEASAKGTVPQQTIQAYTRALKADGKWADAYGLWIAQQKGPTPLLYNGSFDRPFQPNGFDWEVTPVPRSRAGAVVSQRGIANRGQVLEIQFTGRSLATPVLRQYVFAAPGKYLLRGHYMGSKLRMEQGLAWSARCINTHSRNALAGRSDALQDTAGVWKPFQFSLQIPPDCGLVVSVQLETFAPFEATAGFKGRASFDGIELIAHGL